MMRLRLKAFSLPKAGNGPEQCQDAWAGNKAGTVAAVADGASDSFEAGLWAQALADASVRHPPSGDIASILHWLEAPVAEWRACIHWDQLTWYMEEKARRGAFATLLGVSLQPPMGDHDIEAPEAAADQTSGWADESSSFYYVFSIGDSCLFHVRAGKLFDSFPMQRAADFNNTPPLLSTRIDYSQRSLEEWQVYFGECRPGDLLLLTTDALAAGLLGQWEAGWQDWQALASLDDDSFASFVEDLRQVHNMRNDDTTLLLGWVVEDETGGADEVIVAKEEKQQQSSALMQGITEE